MNREEAQKVLEAAREKDWRELEERRREMARQEEGKEKAKLEMEELLLSLRRASVEDYLAWLMGYIEKGGKPTHVYDYPFARWNWYVAIRHIKPIPLFGSNSFNIIVPAGVSVQPGDWGHCNLFYMDGYSATMFVPIFEDTNFPED